MKGLKIQLLIALTLLVQILQAQTQVAGPDKLYCNGGAPVTLNAVSGYTIYSWSPSTGLSDTSIQNPLASPSVTTTYTLTVIDSSGSYSDQVVVYLSSNSNIDLINGVDTVVCFGDSILLTSLFQGALQWSNLTNGVSSTSDTLPVMAYDTLMIELTVSNDTSCRISDSLSLIGVGPLVTTDVVNTLCLPSGQINVSSSSNVNEPYNIQWFDGDTSFNRSGLSSGSYSYTVTDTMGCSITSVVQLNNQTSNLDLRVSDTTLCDQETAQVIVSGTGGNITTSYQTTVTLGTGSSYLTSNTSYPAVFGHFFRSAKHQILYKASELHAAGVGAGQFSSLSLDVAFINGGTRYCNFQIAMKNSTSQALVGNMESGAINVFQPKTVTIQNGWNDMVFDVPFNWDGVSNIIIDVCFDMTSATNSIDPSCNLQYTLNSPNRYTVTPFPSVLSSRSDVTPQCTSHGNPYPSHNRPNIKLGFEGGGVGQFIVDNVFWSNTSSVSDSSILDPILSPDSTTTYHLTLTDTAGCVVSDSITVHVSDIQANPTSRPTIVPCGIEDVEFFANVTSSNQVVSYIWTGQNDLVPISGNDTMIGRMDLLADSARVRLTVTDVLGCSHLSSVEVTRTSNCQSTITGFVYEDKDTNCVYDNQDVPLVGATVYYDNNVMVQTDATGHFSFQYGSTGNIQFRIPVPNGYFYICRGATFHYLNVPAYGGSYQLGDVSFTKGASLVDGIDDPDRFELRIFPNPANNMLNISTDRPLEHIEVVDLTGRSVYSLNTEQRYLEIPTSDIAIGSYILIVTDRSGNTSTKKFSVMH